LQLCNGKRTVQEIADSLTVYQKQNSKDKIVEFFTEILTNTDFFEHYNPEIPTYQQDKLHIIQLSLTENCNLRCIYCYATDRTKPEHVLTQKEHFDLIDSINSISEKAEVILTGGEPLLVPYTLDLAEYAKKRGNSPQLLTNGTLVDNTNAGKISELFDLVKISIDGSTAVIHDFHRGQNSFSKSMNAFELLLSHNAPVKVSMTVTKKNINDIDSMVKLFGSYLTFAPLFQAGRAKNDRSLNVTGTEYYKALSSVDGVNPLSYLCSSLASAKNKRIMKCAMGDGEISVSESGDVYPCQLLHFPEFKAGNIREQSLKDIYENSEVINQCKKLNVLNIKGCKNCNIRFICGGACRARAYYEKGRVDVADDFCEYEKLAFIDGLFGIYDL